MTDLEIGQKCAEIARDAVLKDCKMVGLTLRKTLRRVKDGLDAKETKANYDKDRGKWVYSAPMVDWSARAKAVDQAISIFGIKAPEKHEHEVVGIEDILREIHGKRQADQKK
jgi:hypothetical protein